MGLDCEALHKKAGLVSLVLFGRTTRYGLLRLHPSLDSAVMSVLLLAGAGETILARGTKFPALLPAGSRARLVDLERRLRYAAVLSGSLVNFWQKRPHNRTAASF